MYWMSFAPHAAMRSFARSLMKRRAFASFGCSRPSATRSGSPQASVRFGSRRRRFSQRGVCWCGPQMRIILR